MKYLYKFFQFAITFHSNPWYRFGENGKKHGFVACLKIPKKGWFKSPLLFDSGSKQGVSSKKITKARYLALTKDYVHVKAIPLSCCYGYEKMEKKILLTIFSWFTRKFSCIDVLSTWIPLIASVCCIVLFWNKSEHPMYSIFDIICKKSVIMANFEWRLKKKRAIFLLYWTQI